MTALEKLTPALLLIDPKDIEEPDLPVAIAVQESNDLLALVGNPEVRTRVLAIGLAQAHLLALSDAIEATRLSQSQWVVLRDRNKSDAQRKREEAGIELRTDLVSACRWNLRDDRVAQATLDVIQQGEGVEDECQDLDDLAALILRHAQRFAGDTTFDALAMAETASNTATEIRTGLSAARLDTTQAAAKELRDRAFTHLDDCVSEIRAAGRHAFRKEPTMRARFASAYQRATERKRARKRAAMPPVGTPAPGAA